MTRRGALISLSIISLAGCSVQGPSSTRASGQIAQDCFSTNFISGYETVDAKTIRVQVGVNRKYDILVSGPRCDLLDWANRLAIETSVTSQICVGCQLSGDELIFRDPISRRRVECQIDEVRRGMPKTDSP